MDMYKEFLMKEEKFLCQLEKNLHDQLNRLKVEELSLLKLISSSADDPMQYQQASLQHLTTEGSESSTSDDDLPLFSILQNKHAKQRNHEIIESYNGHLNANMKQLNAKNNVTNVTNVAGGSGLTLNESQTSLNLDLENTSNNITAITDENVSSNMELSVNETPLNLTAPLNLNSTNVHIKHEEIQTVDCMSEVEESDEDENT